MILAALDRKDHVVQVVCQVVLAVLVTLVLKALRDCLV